MRPDPQSLLPSHKAYLMALRGSGVLMLGIALSACVAAPKQPAVAATQTGTAYETEELDRRARQMGYHVENRNQERLYCQHSSPVGTHIAMNHCLSAELMAQAARDDDEIKNKLSLRGNQLCPSCIQKN